MVAVLAGTTGCSGILGGDSGDGADDPSGPTESAEVFVEALADGDVETANGYLHSEAPSNEVSTSDAESWSTRDPTVENVTVVSESMDGRPSRRRSVLPVAGEPAESASNCGRRTASGASTTT